MAARGQVRNSKKKRQPSYDARVNQLLKKSLDYLERELDLYTEAGGNASIVIQIANALIRLKRKPRAPQQRSARAGRSAWLISDMDDQEEERDHPE